MNIVYYELYEITANSQVPEGTTVEQQLAQLDLELLVRMWPSAGRTEPVEDTREPHAPAWWTSEEDAAAQFLASQGVAL